MKFEIFHLLSKLYFMSTLELPNLKITKLALLVQPIKQLRFLNISRKVPTLLKTASSGSLLGTV